MNGNNITEEKALEERAKFIGAFNGTMIDIWKEKIVDMDIIDTGMAGKSRGYISRTKRSEESKRAPPMVFLEILRLGVQAARFHSR